MLRVDPSNPTPVYEQLRAGVVEQVLAGQMPAGTRLPTVRRLSADLGLAPNTVARAFRELERQGVVETRGRHGTFVMGPPTLDAAPVVDDGGLTPESVAQQFAVTVRAAGLDARLTWRLAGVALGLAE